MTADTPNPSPTRRARRAVPEVPRCDLCGGRLESVGNRRFILYKKAHLPQPHDDALMCHNCGAVYNDRVFEAAVQARAKQLAHDY